MPALPPSLQRLTLNRFAVLGRVGMDLYADPPGTRIEDAQRFTTALGGSAGNIAVALARQGAQAALISAVSDDAVGRYCRAELARFGVSHDAVLSVGGGARNSLAVTETRDTGCQVVLYRNQAADFELSQAQIAAVNFAPFAALVVTGTALAAEPSRSATRAAMTLAREAGALVVLDVDYRAYSWASEQEAALVCEDAAWASDIVVGNDDEFGVMAGTYAGGMAMAEELAMGAAFVVYKQGAAGSVTFAGGSRLQTPIYPVTALKPMGAGDGFMGGLLAGLAAGHDLPSALRRGSATAAMIVAGIGCAPASPDTAALDRFIAQY
jgi:5-dehydro-2-deoxygluconokinase